MVLVMRVVMRVVMRFDGVIDCSSRTHREVLIAIDRLVCVVAIRRDGEWLRRVARLGDPACVCEGSECLVVSGAREPQGSGQCLTTDRQREARSGGMDPRSASGR